MKMCFNKINNIYKFIIILITIILNIWIYLNLKNLNISLLLLVFSMFILVMFFIQERRYENYIKCSLLDLSDMLQTII